MNSIRKIPVFVSCPTDLSPEQNEKREIILEMLSNLQLEPRALGRDEYPKDFPLKEVYLIAKRCFGGIILGFEQIYAELGQRKRNVEMDQAKKDALRITADSPIYLPTPWNHLEAGILFGLKLPLLIFKEKNIEGGVFDKGITDAFILEMPESNPDPQIQAEKMEILRHVFLKWYSLVSVKYNEY